MHNDSVPAYGRAVELLGVDPRKLDLAGLRELAAEREVSLVNQASRVDAEGGPVRTCDLAIRQPDGGCGEFVSEQGEDGFASLIAAVDAVFNKFLFQAAEECLRAEGIDARAEDAGERGWARFPVAEPNGDALIVRSSAGSREGGPTAALAAQTLLRLGLRLDDRGLRWTWGNAPPKLGRGYPRAPMRAKTGLGLISLPYDRRLPNQPTLKRALAGTGASVPCAGCSPGVAFDALNSYAKQQGLHMEAHLGLGIGLGEGEGWTVQLGSFAADDWIDVADTDLGRAACQAIAASHARAGLRRARNVLTAAGFRDLWLMPERHGFLVKMEHVPDQDDPSLILLVSARSPVAAGRDAAAVLSASGFAEVPEFPGRWRVGQALHHKATEPASPTAAEWFGRLRKLAALRPNRPNGRKLHFGSNAPEQGFGGARVIFAVHGDWRSGPDDFRPDPLVVLTPFCFSAGWMLLQLLNGIWIGAFPIDKYSLCSLAARGAQRYQASVGEMETERGMLGAMIDAVEAALAERQGGA